MNLPEELKSILQIKKVKHSQLTLVTGVFDVLHWEHKQFLKAAKKLSGILIVGLESDERVKEIKGQDRPINSSLKRQENLQKWALADLVFILPAEFGQKEVRTAWLKAIRPDYLAVSSHSPLLAIKKKEIRSWGGEVKIVRQFNPQISSSKLIAKKSKMTSNTK